MNIIYIPLIIGFVTNIILLYGGEEFMSAEYIALTVAILSVAGTLLAQLFQFKKDSNTIGKVKEDTIEIKPNVLSIKKDTEKLSVQVGEQMIPSLNSLSESKDGVKELVEELRYQKRLKSETTPYVQNMDLFISGIQNVYETNAKLVSELREERLKNHTLLLKNTELEQELRYYKKQKDMEQGNEWIQEL